MACQGDETEFRTNIARFEASLDEALSALPSFGWEANATLRLACELYEMIALDENNVVGPEWIARGIMIFGKFLVSGKPGYKPQPQNSADVQQLTSDLLWAGHYYMVREYLYYTYNAKGSMSWDFRPNRVDIRFGDRTVPRQFFTVANDLFMGTVGRLEKWNKIDEILRLLENEPEGVHTPNTIAALELIQEEVELKIDGGFSILPSTSNVDLGGYSYAEFLSVYRQMLLLALYHRYLAYGQGLVGALYVSEDEFIAVLERGSGLSQVAVRRILADLIFDAAAAADRLDGALFSIMRDASPDRTLVIRPHHLVVTEGIVNTLRVIAQRRPKLFLNEISNPMGKAFVARMKSAWQAQGFTCRPEVSLKDFDPKLPDIDLLVISEEPTLGYVVFVCELKSPVPPRWAKDQLKALQKDNVSKAFRQVDALNSFLGTDAGLAFIQRQLPATGHPIFSDFVVSLVSLIITSDNSGMFFGEEKTRVINFRTLERLLERSDGDVALILRVLSNYNDAADELLKVVTSEFFIGDLQVRYDGVAQGPYFDFPRGTWNSIPDRTERARQYAADGGHPFDVFKHRPPDAHVIYGRDKS